MFADFLDFPAEIHYLILEACSPNDRICLRLTSKYMYNLSTRPTSSRSSDNSSDSKRVSLQQYDFHELCGGISPDADQQAKQSHRWECHALCKAADIREKAIDAGKDPSHIVADIPQQAMRFYGTGRNRGPGIRTCKTRGWRGGHCDCYNRPLWKRLQPWIANSIGKDFRYCITCNMFTKRKRGHQGKCYHGYEKPKKQQRMFVTSIKSGGGVRQKAWKKWKYRSVKRRQQALAEERGKLAMEPLF